MSEIIYSPQKRDFIKGHRYANPRYFSEPDRTVDSVIIVGEYQNIIDAYRMQTEAKVLVLRSVEELVDLFDERAGKVRPKPNPVVRNEVTLPDADEVASMAFPVLKQIAGQLSNETIRSRKQAEAIVASARALI